VSETERKLHNERFNAIESLDIEGFKRAFEESRVNLDQLQSKAASKTEQKLHGERLNALESLDIEDFKRAFEESRVQSDKLQSRCDTVLETEQRLHGERLNALEGLDFEGSKRTFEEFKVQPDQLQSTCDAKEDDTRGLERQIEPDLARTISRLQAQVDALRGCTKFIGTHFAMRDYRVPMPFSELDVEAALRGLYGGNLAFIRQLTNQPKLVALLNAGDKVVFEDSAETPTTAAFGQHPGSGQSTQPAPSTPYVQPNNPYNNTPNPHGFTRR